VFANLQADPQFSFVHNEFLAVEAVSGEPVSVRVISLFGGKIQGTSADSA
jgi:hypothetical protein